MHFCSVCQNMYYIRIDAEDPNKLVYYCRHCGNEDAELTVDNISVSKTQLSRSESNFSYIINKFTKLDPTLPRINKIKCPNPDCETNVSEAKDREIIYIRYDDMNMKYVYLCSTCDFVWKTDEQK
jgi:DNA-directed RNA polymerase subunit M/transcription elongation factor TFIIS